MRARRLLVIPILLSLTGCGTLFNQQRSDTAVAAQKKFTGVNLADLLKEERKHNGEILVREIEIAQRQMTAARDAKLIAIVTSENTKAAVDEAVKARVKELQGDDAQIAGLLIRIEQGEENLRAAGDKYLVLRNKATDPKLECSGDATVSERAKSAWARVQNRCENLKTLRTTLATRTASGLLGETALRIATTERARDELAAQLKTAQADANASASELAAAQKTGKTSVLLDPAALNRIKEQVTKIRIPSAEQLSSAGIDDVRAAAALRWTEIQRAAVEKVLAAVTSGANEAPPGTNDALQIAAGLPSLAAQLREGFRYPRVSALVMESQRLRIEADRYRRQLARVDEELALQRAKLLRLRAETRALSEATVKFNEGDVDTALAKYAEGWTVSRIPMTEIEWKLIGLTHDRALDQSESAIAQWEALVKTPLEALVASAGSGLKPEEISGLVHALELGALAAGVY